MTVITKDHEQALLGFARTVLENHFKQDKSLPQLDDPVFADFRGTFVTLKIGDTLRGCIGTIEPVRTIKDGVEANVVSAAFHDTRFAPLSREELDRVHISISILTQAEPLLYDNTAELRTRLRRGMDGVILRCGRSSATFLPQVWEQLPDAELFLSHLSLKAGLSKDGWKDENIDVLTYQVQSFAEDEE